MVFQKKKSNSKARQLKWNGATEDMGSFSIPAAQWQRIWIEDQHKVIQGKYASIISDCFDKAEVTNCILNIQNVRVNKDSIIFYGYCAHLDCRTFTLVCKDVPALGQPVTLYVTAFGKMFHEEGRKLTRYVTGFMRDDLKKKLTTKSAFEVRNEAVNLVSEGKVLGGNLGDIKSLEVFRQIKSEDLSADDRHPNVLINVLLDWEEQMKNYKPDDVEDPANHVFIHRFGVPMFLLMHSIEELQLFVTAVKDCKYEERSLPLHLDATSSVVQAYMIPNIKPLRCFYYALTFSVKGRIVTLSSAILSQHDTCHIAMWLLEVRFFMTLHQHWPIPKNLVVIDGSYPLLYSTLLVFNSMTLLEYLSLCHRFVTCEPAERKAILADDITIIKLCCAHKIKNFVESLRSKAPTISKDKQNKRFILQSIGSLFMCAQYQTVKLIFEKLFIILLNKTCNSQVQNSVSFLKTLCNENEAGYMADVEEPLICDLGTTEEAVKEKEAASKALYLKSPFFKDIKEIHRRVELCILNDSNSDASIDEPDVEVNPGVEKDVNNLYGPEFATDLLKNHSSTLCLWTGIVKRPTASKDPTRVSNSTVECFIKITKSDILKGKKNLKLHHFYNKARQYVINIHKEVQLDIPKSACAQNSPKTRKTQPTGRREKIVRTAIKKDYKKTKPLQSAKTTPVTESHADVTLSEAKEFSGTGQNEPRITKRKASEKTITTAKKRKIKFIEDTSSINDQVADFDEFPAFQCEEQWSKRGPKVDVTGSYFPSNLPTLANLQVSSQPLNVQTSESETASHSITPLAQSVENTNDLFLENGLLNDAGYYAPLHDVGAEDRGANYFICKFTEHPFGGVFFRDFDSLRPNQWLNGYVMDAVAEAVIKQEGATSFFYIPTIHSSAILDGSASILYLKFYSSSIISEKEFIVLFYNKRRCHWCTVVIHIPSRAFYFFDPMLSYGEKDLSYVQKHLRNFTHFFKQIYPSLPTKGWKVSSPNHPLQKDFVNCGILSLFYLIHIVKNKSIPSSIPDTMVCINGSLDPFDADSLRKILQKLLLQSSEPVHNSCATCSRAENQHQSIFCSYCKRWVHDTVTCNFYFPADRPVSGPICHLCHHFQARAIEQKPDIAEEFRLALKECSKKEEEQSEEEIDFLPSSISNGEFDYDSLFYFQDYTKPASTPQFIHYIPRKVSERFVNSFSKVQLYFARNPFPSLKLSNVDKPWCFYTLANGLIDNLCFYIKVPTVNRSFLNYPVASFRFPYLDCGDIYFEDFASLNTGELVTNVIIDVSVNLFLNFFNHQKRKIFYLTTTLSKTLFGQAQKSLLLEIPIRGIVFPHDTEYICMIHHDKAHYTLVIIDRNQKTVFYFDPYGGAKEQERGKKIVSQLNALNQLYKFSDEGSLRLAIDPHVLQSRNDSTNCALYCLFFIEQWLLSSVEQIILETKFCPENYRDTLKETILWHSEDMSQICSVCNIDDVKFDLFSEFNKLHFVQCMDCERAVHLKSECLLFKLGDVQSWEPSEYYCPLCVTHRGIITKKKLKNHEHDRLKICTSKERIREMNDFWNFLLP